MTVRRIAGQGTWLNKRHGLGGGDVSQGQRGDRTLPAPINAPEGTEAGALRPSGNRGRLMNAQQIADELFHGHVTAAWVRRNLPGKIVLGHSTVCWYEDDVLRWIQDRRLKA